MASISRRGCKRWPPQAAYAFPEPRTTTFERYFRLRSPTSEHSRSRFAEPVHAFAVQAAGEAPGTISRSSDALATPLPDARKPHSLADKPSIAVLPFQNIGGDPEQDYFADGMVEDIITGLSRSRLLLVIARNSTSPTKAKPSTSGRSAANSASAMFWKEAYARPETDTGNRTAY